MRLKRYTIEGFRAFAERVELDDLKKVNLIVGPNNIGKTCLLLPLRRITRADTACIPRFGWPVGTPTHGSGMTNSVWWADEDFAAVGNTPTTRDQPLPLVLEFDCDIEGTLASGRRSNKYKLTVKHDDPNTNFSHNSFSHLAPLISFIPTKRFVDTNLEPLDLSKHMERQFDGSGLCYRLIDSFLPEEKVNEHYRKQLKKHFSTFTGMDIKKIWATFASPSVQLELEDGTRRSVQDMGEGLSQLLVIADTMAQQTEPGILLIDEPETALHPTLQRRFIQALLDQEQFQVFITTHSNHILDIIHDELAIYRVHRDTQTQHRAVTRLGHSAREVLSDLGVRPSSISAANCVIWVEGPSDAIYLRMWFEAMGWTDMNEGVDFAFGFLGCALLAHTTMQPEESGEHIIDLLTLNPNSFIIVDHDTEKLEDGTTRPGKRYLRDIIEEDGEFPERNWITDGKEVESYIPDSVLLRCKNPDQELAVDVANPDDGFKTRLENLGLPKLDKVSWARAIRNVFREVDSPRMLMEQGLQGRLENLRAFIQSCQQGIHL